MKISGKQSLFVDQIGRKYCRSLSFSFSCFPRWLKQDVKRENSTCFSFEHVNRIFWRNRFLVDFPPKLSKSLGENERSSNAEKYQIILERKFSSQLKSFCSTMNSSSSKSSPSENDVDSVSSRAERKSRRWDKVDDLSRSMSTFRCFHFSSFTRSIDRSLFQNVKIKISFFFFSMTNPSSCWRVHSNWKCHSFYTIIILNNKFPNSVRLFTETDQCLEEWFIRFERISIDNWIIDQANRNSSWQKEKQTRTSFTSDLH